MIRPLVQLRTKVRSVLIAMSATALVVGNVASVGAAALTSASVSLGDPRTGETTTYTVTASGFTTGTSISCVEVDLDTAASGSGGNPTSDTTSSTLDSTTLLTPASWSVDNSTDGTLRITSVGGENPSASGNIVWGSVDNGSTENTTYYALLTTFTDASCTGGNEVDTVVMAFTYTDGELVTLTIDPTLTFSVNDLGSGVDVNGTNTTVGSTATGIDFGSAVTSSANGVSGHRLDVSTNATGGYNVYIRHTGDLTNAASDTIDVWTGTNAAPTVFPAAGTEAWGYTTEDADLTQFSANEYAGFTTSNEVVMTNTAATAGTDQVEVGHQVGVAATTEAGTYQTTIIYTIVATY